MICSLTAVAIIYYLWLMFGSSVFAAKTPLNPDGQHEKFGGIVSAEDGPVFKAGGGTVERQE